MRPRFTHLHVHTDFSMLDGLGKVDAYAARAKKLGMGALAITDHGNMSGAYEFYKACMKEGIEPIIGEEFYFVPDAQKVKDEKVGERFHVVMLAKDVEGYRILCELSSIAHRNFYYKPVLDRKVCETLGDAAEHIVVLSGCAASILSRKVMGAIPGSASTELQWWRETFPNFYIELQHHGTDFDRKLNGRLLQLSNRYKLPWVITNDPHYVTEDQCEPHDALLAIQTSAQIDQEERFRFDGEGYHLKSAKEMYKTMLRYGTEIVHPGMAETMRIAKQCRIRIPEWDKITWHIPKYRKLPEGVSADDYLKKLTIRGLKERGLQDNEEYVERAKEELRAFRKVGIADFLLITYEIIKWANDNHIWVGPGRGSTAGSLVGYLTGIHKVDSMRYGLLFERFLNPDRPKQPDIDTDFSQRYRDRVIDHIVDEYGVENVLPVAAFQTLKVRGAFRRLATAMGMPFKDLSKFTQIMNAAWGRDDSEEEDEEQEEHVRIEHLPEELLDEYPELVEYIEAILGTKSAISRHAAGLIIFDPDDPIRSLVPEMWHPRSKKFAAQFNLHTAESLGLMKQDILGLRNGDTIEETKTLIKNRHSDHYDMNEWLDPDEWIPDEMDGDSYVYAMLADGRNTGVFQLEGGTMAPGITKIRPRRFEDIVTCTALYRKGPIIAGAPDRFLANKKARTVKVAHESMEPILEASWGEMIYDEQMFELLHKLAGFSWSRVDDAKTAMKKKDPKMMAAIKPDAVSGFQKVSGMSKSQAAEVWRMIEAQSSYLFNRSHAVAYSLVTYQTARYKRWFPLEYLTACMRTVTAKDDRGKRKRQTYLAEAADLGFKILPPDINLSEDFMSCGGGGDWDEADREEPGWMRFGFTDIKGIGESAATKIMNARYEWAVPFKSERQVRKMLPPGLCDTLSAAGCFESIGGAKAKPEELEELVAWQFNDIMAPVRLKYRKKVRLPGRRDGRCLVIGELISREKKTTKTNKPYMTWKLRWSPSEIFAATIWDDAEEVWDTPKGSIIMIEGKYSAEYNNLSIGNPEQVRILRYSKHNSAA